jgi:hypothetical protein
MACNQNCNQGRACDCVPDVNINPHLADDLDDWIDLGWWESARFWVGVASAVAIVQLLVAALFGWLP